MHIKKPAQEMLRMHRNIWIELTSHLKSHPSLAITARSPAQLPNDSNLHEY